MSAGRDRTTLEKAPERAAAQVVPPVHRDDVTPVAVPGLATGIQRRSVGDDPLGGTTVAPEIGTALRRRQGGGPAAGAGARRAPGRRDGRSTSAGCGSTTTARPTRSRARCRRPRSPPARTCTSRAARTRRGRPAATTCWPTSSRTSSRPAAASARRRDPSSAPRTTLPRPPPTPMADSAVRRLQRQTARVTSVERDRVVGTRARRSPRCAGRPSGPGPCAGGTRSRRCSVATEEEDQEAGDQDPRPVAGHARRPAHPSSRRSPSRPSRRSRSASPRRRSRPRSRRRSSRNRSRRPVEATVDTAPEVTPPVVDPVATTVEDTAPETGRTRWTCRRSSTRGRPDRRHAHRRWSLPRPPRRWSPPPRWSRRRRSRSPPRSASRPRATRRRPPRTRASPRPDGRPARAHRRFTGAEKKEIATDPAAMAKGRTHLGDLHYMSLLAAVDTNVKKTDKVDSSKNKHHLTGAEADEFIRTNIEDYPHLKPFVEAAVGAGKKGEGYVASISPEDWAIVYGVEFPTDSEARAEVDERVRVDQERGQSGDPARRPRHAEHGDPREHAPLRAGRRPDTLRLRPQRGHHRVLHAGPHRPERGPGQERRARTDQLPQAGGVRARHALHPRRVEGRPGEGARADLLRRQAHPAGDQVQGRAPGEDQHDDRGGAGDGLDVVQGPRQEGRLDRRPRRSCPRSDPDDEETA